MKFKDALNTIRRLVTVKKNTRKYLIYATIVIAILGIVGAFIQRNLNAKLELEKVALEQLNIDRAEANAKLNAQVIDLEFLTSETLAEIGVLRETEVLRRAEIEYQEGVIRRSKAESSDLETQLEEAHDTIAGRGLKDSFLAERITSELGTYFPESGHVFFSETQDNLFKTNPETANLIYAIITENAVRIQLVDQLQLTVDGYDSALVASHNLVVLKGEEILAYENLVVEFDETFDNLESALSLERRTTANLERQIAIMNRKNLFERILPSLNIVIGPYYDPFNNRGGFAVALGLGWRF